jgi:catechol 2,3-dioxygenase-like lactoylglutathione lyase family enzyme
MKDISHPGGLKMDVKSKAAISEIHTVAIAVTDHARSIDFYVNKLGFEKRMDAPFGPGLRWVEVAPKGAATTLALAPEGPTSHVGADTGVRFQADDVDALHARFVASGVDADAEVMRLGPGVPPMFSFRDPDGNRLYVVEGR